VRALAVAAARQLTWASPATARQVLAWRKRANAIPDLPIRRDALNSLERKRSHIDGATLFAIIPTRRSGDLIQLLVAYQIIFDFLDCVNERAAGRPVQGGVQLHLALVDALDPTRRSSDYYAHHPWRDDGGYLRDLVTACRNSCLRLPGYEQVYVLLLEETVRFNVLALNHVPCAAERDLSLRRWSGQRQAGAANAWFELAAGGSSSLVIHMLLALAAEPVSIGINFERLRDLYAEVISVMGTMLDSYVDQVEDATSSDHSYVAHYPNPEMAVRRLERMIERGLREALALCDGERHAVIVACMVAMYLSKSSARSPELRAATTRLAAAGGSLTMFLLPILRMWRIAYSQRGH
jgi:tetraprenyl-beta-curcumene synthase